MRAGIPEPTEGETLGRIETRTSMGESSKSMESGATTSSCATSADVVTRPKATPNMTMRVPTRLGLRLQAEGLQSIVGRAIPKFGVRPAGD